MLPVQLIRKKRDGHELVDSELRAFIAGVTDGSIPDYQVASMLMAIYFKGFGDRELATWADAMTHTGDVLDLSRISRAKIDKHSTGGVGDKISIPLAPAVAACGVAVPMVSGRGLGHTGGTLDKLESIPGFRVDLPAAKFAELVDRLGVCLIGQTSRIAPADKILYALRDVTATVESLPMIASSIMSKKLAEGIDGLVIDCKVGRGAFMKTIERARELCALMRGIGSGAGKRVTCVLTDMDAPIGRTIGNALEIRESIEILRGGGPSDTRELTHVLGAEMLVLGGAARDPAEGRAKIEKVLADGSALELFRKIVEAQGGDPRVCDSPGSVLPKAAHRDELVLRPGRIVAIDSEALGIAALILGAGRRTKEDAIDPAAGLVCDAYLGEVLAKDGPPSVILCHNLAPGDPRVAEARAMIERAVRDPARSPARASGARIARARGDPMTAPASPDDLFARIQSATAAIRARVPAPPQVGLILGSGLGAWADRLERSTEIDYPSIPGFPRSTVQGHDGRLVLGERAGVRCVAMQGRVHMYEGHSAATVAFPARVLIALGAKILIVTNAAGGLDPSWPPGTLMLIRDHIDLLRDHPLRGPNDERLGPRFPDMTTAYAPELRALVKQTAAAANITLQEGVYVAMPGPTYETPAEVQMLRTLGADATGMSTVPEVIVARHMGARALGISCITNQAAGITGHELSHHEVTETAARVRTTFEALLDAILAALRAHGELA